MISYNPPSKDIYTPWDSFHVKCGIFGFYNIKNKFNIIIKMKCLNWGIGLCEVMLKKLSC